MERAHTHTTRTTHTTHTHMRARNKHSHTGCDISCRGCKSTDFEGNTNKRGASGKLNGTIMLICDLCEHGWHVGCLQRGARVEEVPSGCWYCAECEGKFHEDVAASEPKVSLSLSVSRKKPYTHAFLVSCEFRCPPLSTTTFMATSIVRP